MRAQNKSIKKYWIKNLSKFEQDEKSNINLAQDFFKVDYVDHGNESTNSPSYGGGGDDDDKNSQKSKSNPSPSSANSNIDSKAEACESKTPTSSKPYSFLMDNDVRLPAGSAPIYYDLGFSNKFVPVRDRKFEYLPVSSGMRRRKRLVYEEYLSGGFKSNGAYSQYFASIIDGRVVLPEEKRLMGDTISDFEYFAAMRKILSPRPMFDFPMFWKRFRVVHWSRSGYDTVVNELKGDDVFIFSLFGKGFLKPS